MWKTCFVVLPTKSPTCLSCYAIGRTAGLQLSRGPLRTTRSHLKYHMSYPYLWLRNIVLAARSLSDRHTLLPKRMPGVQWCPLVPAATSWCPLPIGATVCCIMVPCIVRWCLIGTPAGTYCCPPLPLVLTSSQLCPGPSNIIEILFPQLHVHSVSVIDMYVIRSHTLLVCERNCEEPCTSKPAAVYDTSYSLSLIGDLLEGKELCS